MKVMAPADPVDRAVAAVRSAQDRLVVLLGSKEESISQKAAAALTSMDPLPVWPVAQALLKARNADLRRKLVEVLAAIGPVEPLRVTVALGAAIKVGPGVALKSTTMIAMKSIFADHAGRGRPRGHRPRGPLARLASRAHPIGRLKAAALSEP
jgi:hypothetical protein